ncbi:hypothetical protein BIY27_03150 [Gibbsiella quercinecans]|nr:hypothetical protein BIY27_03150 [Gibbsiella quercinecans]
MRTQTPMKGTLSAFEIYAAEQPFSIRPLSFRAVGMMRNDSFVSPRFIFLSRLAHHVKFYTPIELMQCQLNGFDF